MDAVRLGSVCRALRIKKQWRQADLAARARVSRAAVSRLERAQIGDLGVDTIVRIIEALGGRIDFMVRWQGGELDRLLNARHSALHEAVAREFRRSGDWVIAPEVSFAIRGERGVIDILAWHVATRTLLVIELKTEIVDINELMGTIDRKRRLAATIARERGWFPTTVAVWVVVADSVMNRRRVRSHATTLRAAFPSDGRAVTGWLRHPDRELRCLSFWSNAHQPNAKSGFASVRRVRRRSPRAA
ncbi:MAG: helix-turn-helix domain-containing protein [Chloroflexota bacterium]